MNYNEASTRITSWQEWCVLAKVLHGSHELSYLKSNLVPLMHLCPFTLTSGLVVATGFLPFSLHCTSVRRRQRAVHPKMTLKPMLYPKPASPLICDRVIRVTWVLGTSSLCKSLHVQKRKLLLTCNTTSPAWWRTNAPPITTPPSNTAAKNTVYRLTSGLLSS